MSKYFTMLNAYDDSVKITYKDSVDKWPFGGSNRWWRNDPLSDKSFIRPNRAGYYPYEKTYKMHTPVEDPWKYTFQPVCSTRFPSNPQYEKTKEIILFR